MKDVEPTTFRLKRHQVDSLTTAGWGFETIFYLPFLSPITNLHLPSEIIPDKVKHTTKMNLIAALKS